MKPSLALFIGVAAFVFALLGGCGQTGPLYMPKIPAATPALTPGAAPPSAPVPSTVPAAQQ